jgi:hypothetical protein
MVKHADAAELRVVAAAVLAASADAVLVTHHLPKLGLHLATALARLHVCSPVQRSSLEAESTREKRGGGGRKRPETPCESLARETGNTGGARACTPNERVKWFYYSDVSSYGRRTKRAECGRVRLRK